MMNDELELPNPEKESAARNKLITFLPFTLFGFVPLIPYLVLQEPTISFAWPYVFAFVALVILGIVSAYVSERNKRITILETVVVGTTAASVAFVVEPCFR